MEAEPHQRYSAGTAGLRNLALAVFASALSLSVVSACPLCHTETGRQVRAGIFQDSFITKLAVTAAPFPVFGGVIAFIYFGKPKGLKRKQRTRS